MPAGFGARVVQERQEQLVASAWEQIGDARGVVQLERRLEVAVELLGSVMRRRVEPMEVGQMVQFLGPAQTRMRASPETLRAVFPSGVAGRIQLRDVSARPAPGGHAQPQDRIPQADQPANGGQPHGYAYPRYRTGPRHDRIDYPLELVKGFDIFGQRDQSQQRFRDAAAEAQQYFDRFTRQFPIIPKPPFALTATFKGGVVASLNPQQTASSSFYAQISSADGAVQPPAQPGPKTPKPQNPKTPWYNNARTILIRVSNGLLIDELNPLLVSPSSSPTVEAYNSAGEPLEAPLRPQHRLILSKMQLCKRMVLQQSIRNRLCSLNA